MKTMIDDTIYYPAEPVTFWDVFSLQTIKEMETDQKISFLVLSVSALVFFIALFSGGFAP